MPRRGGPKTPEGKARALQNLIPFRKNHDRHGAYAVTVGQQATQELTNRIMAVLEGDLNAVLKPADKTTVGLLAVLLRRIEQAEAYLDRNGLVNGRGQVRPVAQLLAQYVREAHRYCESLGLTPTARARLGLDVARTADIAQLLASPPDESAEAAPEPEAPGPDDEPEQAPALDGEG